MASRRSSPVPAEWKKAVADAEAGVRAALRPLATTSAGRAVIELLATHASNPRVEVVRLAPVGVEHEEQLAKRTPTTVKCFVVDVAIGHRTEPLAIGSKAAVVRFGEVTLAPTLPFSVWERDEWKFEGAPSEVIDALMPHRCLLELSDRQWVVGGKKKPWQLVTSQLHGDFEGTRVLERQPLDPSLGLGELFLRGAAQLVLPRAGKKVAFAPDVEITSARIARPAASDTGWSAEFTSLLKQPFTSSKLRDFVRARPAARPALLTAVGQGNTSALMAASDLFDDEPDWLAALVTASTRRPLSYVVFAELKRRLAKPVAKKQLEALFVEGPAVDDRMSERVLLELAVMLGRSDERVDATLIAWLEGKKHKDAEYAVKKAIEQLPLSKPVREALARYAKKPPKRDDVAPALVARAKALAAHR